MFGITEGLGLVPEAQRYWAPVTSGDPIAQQIIDSLDARLRTILTANGYRTNAGTYVYRWRDNPVDKDKLPAITYRDVPNLGAMDAMDSVMHSMTILLDIHVRGSLADATPPDDTLRLAIADVETALGVDETFGGIAEYVSIPDQDVDIQQVEKAVMAARLTFTITYVTRRLNPDA